MKFCHNCGTRLEDDMSFCPNCGTVQLKLNRTGETASNAAADPFTEEQAAVEAPVEMPSAVEPAEIERPQPASALEYGKPPVFRQNSYTQAADAGSELKHSARTVSMPSLTRPTFQGRPVHGEAIADGMVPKGTEGSFSAGYGRGTEQSMQPVPAFKPDQPYQGNRQYQTNWPHQTNWPYQRTGDQASGGQTPVYGQAPGQNGGKQRNGKSGGKTVLIVLLALILIAAVAIVAVAASMVIKGGTESVETGSSDHMIYSDGEVYIGEGYLFKDFAGDDAIAVEITWTNNGKNADFAGDVIDVWADQDGSDLIVTYPSDLDDFNDLYNKRFELVAPGDSVTFVVCFALDNLDDPVNIEVVNANESGSATCMFTIK